VPNLKHRRTIYISPLDAKLAFPILLLIASEAGRVVGQHHSRESAPALVCAKVLRPN
jgi:hypothetical protein